ncbi:bilirubin oxidase [Streptomyces sp. WAC 06738]|uniref:multicopper oxidase family protein n=1 Tax=Streptomyces sp. WAC 06738 TaxID=2203210 RepID=UPI000F6B9F7A|nr:multicopper oxidase family protein [Streptomyces sp. WAC 06738]AZM49792.1 bilirubin oxidase [Streptomyces sp. WAC 06738]
MVTRRRALAVGVAAGSTALTGAGLIPLANAANRAASDAPGTATADTAGAGTATVAKFAVPMPVPPVLAPTYTVGSASVYHVTMKKVRKEILPGLPTDVLTYNGHFPGPTIRARRGGPVVIRQRNTLDMPTAVHLHGAAVHPVNDGHPMDTIAPGAERLYFYPNQQPHAPLWYHDHAHHMEAEHVYRGLSGSYLLTDDTESALPLPGGRYEVVIALRDARFDDTGGLVYAMGDRTRTTLLANGVPYPYFQVAARKYRLRLLNSANVRSFDLRLADGGAFQQIGSDGGLLTAPYTTDRVFLSAGERADIVVDFSRYPVGSSVVLRNAAGPGTPEQTGEVLRFDIVRTAADPSSVPARLRTLPDRPEPTAGRTVDLSMTEDGSTPPAAYIDGKVYDPGRVDAAVTYGAHEVWTVTNSNRVAAHNFHLHLVQFRVLERGGLPPSPAESGLKDTVFLAPGETVKLQASFDTYRGDFPYHCHMLDHSAMGMMATMRIG